MRVGIVDYGLGNLRSVLGAVERLGHEPVVTSDPAELERTEKLILPGVGAFGDGMRNLRERKLVEPLGRMVLEQRRSVLGLCLGAQLLARESEEFGRHEGLGWIDAVVRRIAPSDSLRVPHVGWNELHVRRPSVLLYDLPDDALFYYVHSFHLVPADEAIVVGTVPYGGDLVAVVESGNVYGTQFHPEKSQLAGLTLLGNFLERG
jgi:imidazole glycerol-phosphate synthase subunit HisH